MDFLLTQIIDIFLHLDHYIGYIINMFGLWTYAILFTMIFAETGLIVFFFMPGDSAIFIVGALSATGQLNIFLIIILLSLAAILGNIVNYHIGKYIGPKIFNKEDSKLFNRKHLIEAHDFYEKYGAKAIILARFIPIIRVFAPFVAGIGSMSEKKFILYSVIGGVGWVLLFSTLGYFFGNITYVRDNFSLVVLAIIVISLLPILINGIIRRYKNKKE